MPIYEFKCKNCQRQFEQFLKMSDLDASSCPHCQGTQLERLVSAPAFQLKGSGWYATDFKNTSAPSQEKKVEAESTPTKKQESSE